VALHVWCCCPRGTTRVALLSMWHYTCGAAVHVALHVWRCYPCGTTRVVLLSMWHSTCGAAVRVAQHGWCCYPCGTTRVALLSMWHNTCGAAIHVALSVMLPCCYPRESITPCAFDQYCRYLVNSFASPLPWDGYTCSNSSDFYSCDELGNVTETELYWCVAHPALPPAS
jgi:hypothetical protein